jgi:hypothetical protein
MPILYTCNQTQLRTPINSPTLTHTPTPTNSRKHSRTKKLARAQLHKHTYTHIHTHMIILKRFDDCPSRLLQQQHARHHMPALLSWLLFVSPSIILLHTMSTDANCPRCFVTVHRMRTALHGKHNGILLLQLRVRLLEKMHRVLSVHDVLSRCVFAHVQPCVEHHASQATTPLSLTALHVCCVPVEQSAVRVQWSAHVAMPARSRAIIIAHLVLQIHMLSTPARRHAPAVLLARG